MKTLTAPWWCCHGWRPASLWCLLDLLAGCKIRAVCDRHDRMITRSGEDR